MISSFTNCGIRTMCVGAFGRELRAAATKERLATCLPRRILECVVIESRSSQCLGLDPTLKAKI